MKRTALLGIDIQNDFTKPTGSLFVKGADSDVIRMSSFVDRYGSHVDYVALTLDSHQPIHIANQCYWKDYEGYPPALYTNILAGDVERGKWKPQYCENLALDYLFRLEEAGQTCTIWPTHCVMGTQGWAVNDFLMNALVSWCITGSKTYEMFYKGSNIATEHYSIFKAAVEYDHCEETKLNLKLLNKLESFDQIVIMGEAADYCVMNSLKDWITFAPHMSERTVVLTDCMSWISPENIHAKLLFERVRELGVKFTDIDGYATLN